MYSLFLLSGVAGLRGSFTLSRGTGEEVRWSILAGVLALLGRLLGVDGLPRVDVGFGEAAELGEAVLPLGVAGEDGRCLDKGLGLEEKKFFNFKGQEKQLFSCLNKVGHIILLDLG